MTLDDIGFQEFPVDDSGIKHFRTKSIHAWLMRKSLQSLHALSKDMGGVDFPGLYILFEGERKVWVGESKSLVNRLNNHITSPDEKIPAWDRVICFNDGRQANHSDFNDEALRKALEFYLNHLFKTNKYNVVSACEQQNLNAAQKHTFESAKRELLYLFTRQTLITKDVESREEREVFSDEVKDILTKRGMAFEYKEKDAVIAGEKTFIRPGSKKPGGYQITIRGGKEGSFIDFLKKRKGRLLMPRDGVLFIPLSKVMDVIGNEALQGHDTADVWVTFEDGKAFLRYGQNKIDVSEHRLKPD